jgi:uncharacterized protein
MKNFTNALIDETSPYLLQHAHNPVQWHPWGEAPLAMAKEKDLPILVSIGYSACHWCHVMERESFEDEAVAEYMNSHFVNIKIDREERPDLDQIYMDAVQAIAGNGGWPLNVFLTPDGKPFYGGTYFPPQKAFNRPSWMDVLKSMTDVWTNRRDEAEKQAATLLDHIKKSNSFAGSKDLLPNTETVSFYSEDDCRLIASGLLKTADREEGGFGQAPKFLQTFSLQYLLQYAHLYNDEKSRAHALFTLRKMVNGGIYDQVGGGISRYSTDSKWLAPHFEKMLYDNALLISVLCDAYQVSKDPLFERTIHGIISFLMKEMKSDEGGYFTALDADSDGVEGKYYVWDKAEVETLLGNDAEIFCDYFNVQDAGNWEGKNILHVNTTVDAIATKYSIPVANVSEIIERGKSKLYTARQARTRPGTDDKIILGLNALLLSAFCKAYAALKTDTYLKAAIELFDFIQLKFNDAESNGNMYHTYKNGIAKFPAFLDDYAYFIKACIHLQEVSSDQLYLEKARDLTEYVLAHFNDKESAFMYYTNESQQDIVIRKIDLYDGATPSANAIMASNLSYLSIIFDNSSYRERSFEMVKSVFNAFKKYPGSFGVWASIYLLHTAGINEIVVTGKDIKDTVGQILCNYVPNKVFQSSRSESDMPLLNNKDFTGQPSIYLCRNYSCQAPVFNVSELFLVLNRGGN